VKRFAFVALLLGLILGFWAPESVAAPGPPFSLSPDPLALSAPVGGFGYGFATVTTAHRAIVIQNPATFGTSTFSDTQAGSCWQSYESVGNPIPKQSSCTIQVGFHPSALGSYSDTMTVTFCKKWHVSGGQVVCDSTDGSRSITVNGTATQPDLIVQAIAFTAPANYPPHSYTVTVKNLGNGSADLSGVALQGYYSPNTTYPGDNPACGTTMSGTLTPGATTDVPVGCSFAPAAGDTYLVVKVDATNVLAESDETNNVGSVALP
jgi:hypothetical protein